MKARICDTCRSALFELLTFKQCEYRETDVVIDFANWDDAWGKTKPCPYWRQRYLICEKHGIVEDDKYSDRHCAMCFAESYGIYWANEYPEVSNG